MIELPPCHFTVARDGVTVVVRVSGRLDTGGLATLADRLRDLVEDQGNLRVAVDLTQAVDDDAARHHLEAARTALEARAGRLDVIDGPPFVIGPGAVR